jgi:hypothetical protein
MDRGVQEENHVNGSSKVRVSYSKYKMIPENIIWDDSDDDEEDAYFTQVRLSKLRKKYLCDIIILINLVILESFLFKKKTLNKLLTVRYVRSLNEYFCILKS